MHIQIASKTHLLVNLIGKEAVPDQKFNQLESFYWHNYKLLLFLSTQILITAVHPSTHTNCILTLLAQITIAKQKLVSQLLNSPPNWAYNTIP